MSTKNFTLVSSDEVEYNVSKEAAGMFGIINDMIECLDEINEHIELKVESEVLKKIIEYCEYHKDLKKHELDVPEQPVENKKIDQKHKIKRSDNILEWDINFMKKFNDEELFTMTCASSYLHIEPLFTLCVKSIANLFNGKSAQYIADTYKTNELTADEKEEIRKAHSFRVEDSMKPNEK